MEGRFNGGFLRYQFGGLTFGGAYTWRGLFSEFYGKQPKLVRLTVDGHSGRSICFISNTINSDALVNSRVGFTDISHNEDAIK